MTRICECGHTQAKHWPQRITGIGHGPCTAEPHCDCSRFKEAKDKADSNPQEAPQAGVLL